jgi:hypothetical protein
MYRFKLLTTETYVTACTVGEAQLGKYSECASHVLLFALQKLLDTACFGYVVKAHHLTI